jgi:hypothetical protein
MIITHTQDGHFGTPLVQFLLQKNLNVFFRENTTSPQNATRPGEQI